MEYMLFLLGAITMVNLLVFIVVARWYKYRKTPYDIDEEESISAQYANNAGYSSAGEIGLENGKPSDKEAWPPVWKESDKL